MKAGLAYIVILVSFCLSEIKAQHQNVYSNYVLNMSSINPAAIGKDMALDVNICARKQWSGFNGSPATNYVSVNSMMKKPTVNLGLIVQSDKIALASTQSIYGLYAYRVKIKKVKIALGLQAGLQIHNNDLSKVKKVQEADAVIDQNQTRSVNFITGAGIFIHNNSFFWGLSSPFLYSAGRSFNATTVLMNAGLILRSGKTDLVKPSVMVRRISGSKLTTDLNMTYYFYSKYGIGLSYRLKNAIVVLMEVVVKDQLKLSYCYDYSLSSISKYQNGSHEISLRYLFGKQYNIKNPRALIN